MLGNPVTYPEFEENYRIPFSHGMSLISDELYEVCIICSLIPNLSLFSYSYITCEASNDTKAYTIFLTVIEEKLQRKLWKCGFT